MIYISTAFIVPRRVWWHTSMLN